MTPHETPPRELLRAVATIRWLAMRWRRGEIGLDVTLVNNAIYYAIELMRDWLNDDSLEFFRVRDEERDTNKFARRFWLNLHSFHAARIQEIEKELRQTLHEMKKLEVYETLPFNAPMSVNGERIKHLVKARQEFARYWHLDHKTPPHWTYEQMVTMLETRELIEVNLADDKAGVSDGCSLPHHDHQGS